MKLSVKQLYDKIDKLKKIEKEKFMKNIEKLLDKYPLYLIENKKIIRELKRIYIKFESNVNNKEENKKESKQREDILDEKEIEELLNE